MSMPMSEAFEIMKWPLVTCLLLPGILIYLGLHIVEREIIFVDLALAQVAALGHCVAILLGYSGHHWQTYVWSVSFTLIGAAIFTLTRTRNEKVPQEALIGIVYVVAAAAGLLLLSRTVEGKEELQRTLVGEILTVRPYEIWQTFALFVAVGVVHFIFRKKFLMISFEPERAAGARLAIRGWDFLFYALFGVVVTSFVHIGGVLLVFSYLIIPAVCAAFLADSLPARLLIGWLVATCGSIGGLYASYQMDFPSGAAIVCALGAALVLVGLYAALRPRPVRARGNVPAQTLEPRLPS
jgi:zinc/manganese transport system permease protein